MTTTTTPPVSETTLILKRKFKASRNIVYEAWTKPEHLKKWYAPTNEYDNPTVEVDVRVGGTFRIVMRNKAKAVEHTATGVYREVRANERLVHTWSWEEDPDKRETLVTVEFRDLGEFTEVLLKHELFANAEDRDNHNQGWEGCLSRLELVF